MKSFRRYEWRTPNRMLFTSGLKTFDREVDYISHGCVFSNVQSSWYIRAVHDGDDARRGIEPGRGRAFDLESASSGHDELPGIIRSAVECEPEKGFWIYRFHFRDGRAIGWVVTDENFESEICRIVHGRRSKYERAIAECCSYILKQENYEDNESRPSDR